MRLILVLFLILNLASGTEYFFDHSSWEEARTYVLEGKADWNDGWTLYRYISYHCDQVEENVLLHRIQFFIEYGAYQVDTEDGDAVLAAACRYASRSVIALLLQQSRIGRQGEDTLHRNRNFYTGTLHNKNLNYEDIIHIWELLIANNLTESSFYFHSSWFTMERLSGIEICSLLDFAYQYEHIIKPTERSFWLDVSPKHESYNRWMASHNVKPRPFNPVTCKRPENIEPLFSQITQLGFDPYDITDWDEWLDHVLYEKNIKMAKHLLSTYPDRFEIRIHFGRIINLFRGVSPCEIGESEWVDLDYIFSIFWEAPICELEEFTRFVSEYIFPRMSLDDIRCKRKDLLSFEVRESPGLVKIMDEYIAANS